jgi:hypothetical protein
VESSVKKVQPLSKTDVPDASFLSPLQMRAEGGWPLYAKPHGSTYELSEDQKVEVFPSVYTLEAPAEGVDSD